MKRRCTSKMQGKGYILQDMKKMFKTQHRYMGSEREMQTWKNVEPSPIFIFQKERKSERKGENEKKVKENEEKIKENEEK